MNRPTDGLPLAALGGLVLELGHPARLAEPGEALQHPAELRVRGHLGLHEDRGALRVDAHREQLRGGAAHPVAQQLRVLLDGDGVQVGDEEERLVVVLQRHPLPQRPEVVAEVERVGGGLDPGEDPGPRGGGRWASDMRGLFQHGVGARAAAGYRGSGMPRSANSSCRFQA